MADFHTYSPDLVVVTFKNVIINGFAPDTFVEVERDEDGFMKYVGSLGDVARTKNLNRAGKITITLMAVAPVNDLLQTWADIDESTGLGYGSFLVKDLSGNMFCHSETAWIMKRPKVERGKESGTVQWVFDCADVEIGAGGNIF